MSGAQQPRTLLPLHEPNSQRAIAVRARSDRAGDWIFLALSERRTSLPDERPRDTFKPVEIDTQELALTAAALCLPDSAIVDGLQRGLR